MACVRQGCALVLSLTLCAATAVAAEGLYDQPVLVVNPGMHTALIMRAAADRAGNWAVTGSDDKTVRVWSLADGALARTVRMPAGPDHVGKADAVAISPDGVLIAASGSTGASFSEKRSYGGDRGRRAPSLPQPTDGAPDATTV
jgi:WD domain, G-beta repeat